MISGQVLVAGKFAIRKRRQQPRQAWIRSLSAGKDTALRELPERPAEAPLMPVCCHLFPWRRWGSGAAGGLRKAAACGTARHPGSLTGCCSSLPVHLRIWDVFNDTVTLPQSQISYLNVFCHHFCCFCLYWA